MKKIKVIIPTLIMIVLTVFAVWYFSYWKKPSDINRIEIETVNYNSECIKYTIDFKSNTVTSEYNDTKRVMYFSEEDKENFVHKANTCGFFRWEESCPPIEETDYKQDYNFIVIYNDGSQYKTRCVSLYPSKYSEFLNYLYDELI